MTSPVYCDECGRPNGATAVSCIWCGVPMLNHGAVGAVPTTRVEIGYLDGIDRFEDAEPVRLIISAEGIEVSELVPGTRSVRIPASSILEANTVDGSTTIEDDRAQPGRWWLALRPKGFSKQNRKAAEVKAHDYILTVRYRDGDEVRTAVFHREDVGGLAVVEGLARIVTSLMRRK